MSRQGCWSRGRKLGVQPIADGIEQTDSRDQKLAIGRRQGYLYSAAMPIGDAVEWASESAGAARL